MSTAGCSIVDPSASYNGNHWHPLWQNHNSIIYVMMINKHCYLLSCGEKDIPRKIGICSQKLDAVYLIMMPWSWSEWRRLAYGCLDDACYRHAVIFTDKRGQQTCAHHHRAYLINIQGVISWPRWVLTLGLWNYNFVHSRMKM